MPPNPPIGPCQGLKIGGRQHVSFQRAGRNGEGVEKVLAGEVGDFALGLPDP